MNKKKEEKVIEKYSKTQIVNSQKYIQYKDLLTSILRENISYSTEQVEQKIKEFMKRKVN